MQVEVCDRPKLATLPNCVRMPKNQAVDFNKRRAFNISESALENLLKNSDEKGIQVRFHDSSSKTGMFCNCKEYPYTTIDASVTGKTLFIELTASHPASYSCSLYREEGSALVPEKPAESIVDKVAHKFVEYKTWLENDEGLTFSVKNLIAPLKPRLKVQACSYSQILGPLNCINMSDLDYIHYDQTRIYHIDRMHLNFLLEASEDNKLQFRFQDTENSLTQYRSCQGHPFVQLDAANHKQNHGYRFAIVVDQMSGTAYHCSIQSK